MKKILLILTVLFSFTVFSQKQTNGKIYIDHPAIDVVNQFNEAYISGDLDKLRELVTDDVKVWRLRNRESNGLNWILGTSNYLSKNFINFDIKHYGGAYPDVFEYKQDDIVDVKSTEMNIKEDCDKNKNGVAKQWSIQSPDDIAPILSEFLIINFINFHKCICFI